jgi:hypothetical protein
LTLFVLYGYIHLVPFRANAPNPAAAMLKVWDIRLSVNSQGVGGNATASKKLRKQSGKKSALITIC